MLLQPALVALDTDLGVVYVPAFGWDRVYLIWTFRNFRSLPQKVLSPRQQQLMGSLYRKASNHQAQNFDDAVVVGRIEDFDPSSLSALPSSTRTGKRKFNNAGKQLEPASALCERQALYARFAFHRMTLRAGAGALVALIAILAWHELGAQPVSDSRPMQNGPVTNLDPVITQPLSNPVAAQPSPIQIADTSPIAAAPIAGAEMTAKPLTGASVGAGKREPKTFGVNAHHQATASPKLYAASADQPRVRISGRPRKLVYPVCPETHARGKVSLQAVVGYDGAVSRVRILTGDRVLAAAAVEAVRQWRYEPFSGDTPGLERETNITVSFISNEVVAVSFPNSEALSR